LTTDATCTHGTFYCDPEGNWRCAVCLELQPVFIGGGTVVDFTYQVPDYGVQLDGSVVVKHVTVNGKGRVARVTDD